ncbi:unnamed protein product [Toxocara canis]|uniref:Uncharacterized protein n=1 Tax=Toxocara canis TaxID=6265 RepID=A0A3P7FA49_TOXCA|nr:unnamed protein product [Toxocara canis]
MLELSGRDEGFVCVRPSDFISSIPPRKLREAKAIQVYANHAVSPLKNFPVPVCYARVLEGDELEMLTENEAHPNLVATNSRDHHIAAVKDAVVSGVTPDGAPVQVII